MGSVLKHFRFFVIDALYNNLGVTLTYPDNIRHNDYMWTKYGIFRFDMDEHQLRAIIFEQYPHNPHNYQLLGTVVKKGDVVLDCGASEGYFTLMAAKNASKVYAIEPNRKLRNLLKFNTQFHKNIEIMDFACGKENGTIMLDDNGIGSRILENGDYEVPLRTLDSVFYDMEKKIDYIKADIEGTEEDLLRGADKIIRRDAPDISVCIYHSTNNASSMEEFLKSIRPDYVIKRNSKVLHAHLPRKA